LGDSAVVRPEQAEDPAQEKIEKRLDHGAALSQMGPPLLLSARDLVSGPHALPKRCARWRPRTDFSRASSHW
jgi:hypothetical protein